MTVKGKIAYATTGNQKVIRWQRNVRLMVIQLAYLFFLLRINVELRLFIDTSHEIKCWTNYMYGIL